MFSSEMSSVNKQNYYLCGMIFFVIVWLIIFYSTSIILFFQQGAQWICNVFFKCSICTVREENNNKTNISSDDPDELTYCEQPP